MPPKKQQKPSNKTEQKRKEKVIEDKTFGLKNKKGSKQQKFVKQVNQQVKQGNDPRVKRLEQQKLDEKKRKEQDRKRQAEIDSLFKPVIIQKIDKGADPKSVLCAFFKQGLCGKGDKCKFSHDLSVERKGEKRSLYADIRDDELENDTMDKWDETKLKNVVDKKHGEGNKQQNRTEIVCKYFIQAIEEKKYGWFWVCPNGGNSCMYRHALPPGFILKSDRKKMDEQKEMISIEELVEKERAALGSNVTKVTLESFLAWKKRKREEKVKAMKSKKDKRQKDFKSGKLLGASGREVFEFQPDLADEDDAEAGDIEYEYEEESDGDEKVKGVSENMFVPEEVNASGTQASIRRPQPGSTGDVNSTETNHKGPDVPSASTLPDSNDVSTNDVTVDDVPVDENLFTEDLDDLEDELEELDI